MSFRQLKTEKEKPQKKKKISSLPRPQTPSQTPHKKKVKER